MSTDYNLLEEVSHYAQRDTVVFVVQSRGATGEQIPRALVSRAVPAISEEKAGSRELLEPLREIALQEEGKVLVRHLLVTENDDLIEEFLVSEVFDQAPDIFGGGLQFPFRKRQVRVARYTGDESEAASQRLVGEADCIERLLRESTFVSEVDEEALIAFGNRWPRTLRR